MLLEAAKTRSAGFCCPWTRSFGHQECLFPVVRKWHPFKNEYFSYSKQPYRIDRNSLLTPVHSMAVFLPKTDNLSNFSMWKHNSTNFNVCLWSIILCILIEALYIRPTFKSKTGYPIICLQYETGYSYADQLSDSIEVLAQDCPKGLSVSALNSATGRNNVHKNVLLQQFTKFKQRWQRWFAL